MSLVFHAFHQSLHTQCNTTKVPFSPPKAYNKKAKAAVPHPINHTSMLTTNVNILQFSKLILTPFREAVFFACGFSRNCYLYVHFVAPHLFTQVFYHSLLWVSGRIQSFWTDRRILQRLLDDRNEQDTDFSLR